jgi:phosphoglycolate phosphatase-like HAD superfamily hydrolase
MIYWAMKQLGVQDASTVVKVGDTPADILQGKAAGCGAILGINSGTFTKEELIDAGADLVVQHPGDILQLMKACYG